MTILDNCKDDSKDIVEYWEKNKNKIKKLKYEGKM